MVPKSHMTWLFLDCSISVILTVYALCEGIYSLFSVSPLCYLCANQSTLDCMQVLLDLLGHKYSYINVVKSKPKPAY